MTVPSVSSNAVFALKPGGFVTDVQLCPVASVAQASMHSAIASVRLKSKRPEWCANDEILRIISCSFLVLATCRYQGLWVRVFEREQNERSRAATPLCSPLLIFTGGRI